MSDSAAQQFYCNYLSELPDEEDNMLAYLRHVFASSRDVSGDFSTPSVLRIAKVSKMVAREKHRMEAFVRFQLTTDNIWYATIEPDFNVLPLIEKHFKSRYANQKWLIADLKRGYGIHYDLEKVHIIELNNLNTLTELNQTENAYQDLWRVYFKSTNIVERRNLKLHFQHRLRQSVNQLTLKHLYRANHHRQKRLLHEKLLHQLRFLQNLLLYYANQFLDI